MRRQKIWPDVWVLFALAGFPAVANATPVSTDLSLVFTSNCTGTCSSSLTEYPGSDPITGTTTLTLSRGMGFSFSVSSAATAVAQDYGSCDDDYVDPDATERDVEVENLFDGVLKLTNASGGAVVQYSLVYSFSGFLEGYSDGDSFGEGAFQTGLTRWSNDGPQVLANDGDALSGSYNSSDYDINRTFAGDIDGSEAIQFSLTQMVKGTATLGTCGRYAGGIADGTTTLTFVVTDISPASPVPLPASAILLPTAMLGGLGWARFRRRNRPRATVRRSS